MAHSEYTQFLKGNQVTFQGAFHNGSSDAFIDPSAVTFKLQKPDGAGGHTQVTVPYLTPVPPYTVVRVSLGVYEVDVTLDVSGLWVYHFECPPGQATPIAGEKTVECIPSAFG